ncbi:MAG: VOC family protein [Methanocalculus sp.]|uniref:VOC family protein n=1 Tax=Methanocalculus sp. TaxID=2004547 RepID=UPI0027199437|nr:VOC family protein [Methanocalculus sp.]MDO8842299.1 VOC family protein [Methanocalculus sp.]MDO9540602.1 VOC family protein [Methanocalculus sp.]
MPTFVHIDIAAENVERAKKFYETLFGWKFYSPPGYPGYYLFETTDENGAGPDSVAPLIGGGLGRRELPEQRITCYIGVDAIAPYLKKIEELGGKITMPYTELPGYGALANCEDSEGNLFGLFEEQKK